MLYPVILVLLIAAYISLTEAWRASKDEHLEWCVAFVAIAVLAVYMAGDIFLNIWKG